MKTFITCLIFISTYISSFAQDNLPEYKYMGAIHAPEGPGGMPCYTRYYAPEVYETQTNRYAVYVGDEAEEEVSIEIRNIQTVAPDAEWVRIPSTETGDKYMAVYTSIPAVFEEIKILLDTSLSDNYVIMDFDEEVLIKDKGEEEIVEVVCGIQMNETLIEMLQNALGLEGYYTGSISKVMDTETRNALREYQKDKDLKVGCMELESFRLLGVIF